MSEPEDQGVISGGYSSEDKGSRPAAELEGILLTTAEQPPRLTLSLKSVILDPFWCLAATLRDLFLSGLRVYFRKDLGDHVLCLSPTNL